MALALIRESLKTCAQQKLIILFLKCPALVMLLLTTNVISDLVQHRFADRHGEILILPAESSTTQLVLVDPERRLALDQLHDLLNCLVCAERDQTMHMVNIAVEQVNENAFLFGIFCDVLKNLRPDLSSQIRLAVLG